MNRILDTINNNLKTVLITILVLTIPAFALAMARSTEESDFNPSGGIFALDNELDIEFVSSTPVEDVQFMVLAREDGDANGNVLAPVALRELFANEGAIRSDEALSARQLDVVHPSLGFPVNGIWSLADAVDDALAGDIATASDADITTTVNELLSSSPGLQQTLASSATSGQNGWTSPALMSFFVFDNTGLEDPDNASGDPDQEEYLRDIQDAIRGDQTSITVLGLAIDPALTQFDGAATAIPFLLLAVIAIVFVVGYLQKSYWSAAVVGAGLGLVMIFMNAVLTLTFRGTSLLVALVVPISAISFGVDFFIHALGRVREEQAGNAHGEGEAYKIGIGAVFGALALALGSSVIAFLSNTVAGIEAIIDFGIAAASALIFAWLFLGLLAPRIVLAIEHKVGQRSSGGRPRWQGRLGFFFMSVFAGMAVALLATAPEPALRIAALATWLIYVGVFIIGAYRLALRSHEGDPVTVVAGNDGRIEWVGGMVEFLARHRWYTLGGTVVVAGLSLFSALNVESGSEFRDFFNSNADFVKSLDVAAVHFADGSVNQTILFVEGDLTNSASLATIDAAVDRIDAALPGDAAARRLDGSLDRVPDAAVLARAAVDDPVAAGAVADATGVAITDTDGDGYPDTPEQIEAVFRTALETGLPASEGLLAVSAATAQTTLMSTGSGYGTIVEISVPTAQSLDGVNAALDAIRLEVDTITAGETSGNFSRVALAGDAAIEQEQLDKFTQAMLLALPIAVILCIALASFVMKSFRYAVVAVIPILLVVVMLYGFMTVTGFKVNPVTSTLAAIAVGIGIDFATHFTMRFREELVRFEPLAAVREAGSGTGGALILSAVSSIIGFAIMGFAPMPGFAWFGQLMAVMIFMSVAVALLVLPSLLLIVTPKTVTEPAAPVLATQPT